jgi:penicillin-binding protein 1A
MFQMFMAKKKNKKSVKKNAQHQIPQKEKTPAVKPKKVTIVKKAEHEKHGVKLNDKIDLEKSEHSYRSFFNRRYGRYINGARKPVGIIFKLAIIFFCLALALVASAFLIFGRDLPDVSQLKSMNFDETTRIYDRDGNLLYSIFDSENRKYVPLNYIAPLAVDATLSIEDKNFYSHWGFDLFGIIRAQIANIKDDSISQGASTITQQLAKNVFLSPERTYDRKIKELLLSLEIEWMYSKEEILEMYLNKIAYGSNSFGIEAASETFFGKTAKDLDLLESSVLASLPKAPSYFSPYGQHRDELMGYCKTPAEPDSTLEVVDNEEIMAGETQVLEGSNPEITLADSPAITQQENSTQEAAAVEPAKPKCTGLSDPNYIWGRKDFVMQRMQEDGYVSKEQVDEAWRQGLDLKFLDPVHKIEAPHFVFYIKELLEQKYGKEMVESGGLEVHTSLDPALQSLAEEAVARQAPTNLKYFGADNAGLVAINPKNGQVLAMVGSVDYWNSQIDGQVNVTTSLRQPGSSFKPLIYAAAIMNARIGSGTVLGDYKTLFNKSDVPRNSDNAYHGKMTIRTALAQSRNIPAIKAYYLAGEEDKLLDYLAKIGLGNLKKFKDDFNATALQRGWTFNYGWPMAIGSGEVRLLDLAGAYGVLANGGKFVNMNPILEVRDRKGNVLEKFTASAGEQVIDPQAAYIVTSIISDIAARPAGSWRNTLTIAGHTVAAKTGTSNKKVGNNIYPNNNLIMGYTPSIVVGAWVGNTDGNMMHGDAWAFKDVGPIWQYFLENYLKDKPDEKFPEPEGLKWIGHEVYPSNADMKTNFDGRFKKVETQQTQDTETSSASWVIGGGTKPGNGEGSSPAVLAPAQQNGAPILSTPW